MEANDRKVSREMRREHRHQLPSAIRRRGEFLSTRSDTMSVTEMSLRMTSSQNVRALDSKGHAQNKADVACTPARRVFAAMRHAHARLCMSGSTGDRLRALVNIIGRRRENGWAVAFRRVSVE